MDDLSLATTIVGVPLIYNVEHHRTWAEVERHVLAKHPLGGDRNWTAKAPRLDMQVADILNLTSAADPLDI